MKKSDTISRPVLPLSIAKQIIYMRFVTTAL